MNSYIFESIEQKEKCHAKAFVTSIDHSNFHWHYEYEIILVLKGKVLVSTSPNPVVLEARDVLLLNSKKVHEIQRMDEENLCLFVQIDKSLFNEYKEESKIYNFYLNSKEEEIPPKKEYKEFVKLLSRIGLEFIKDDMKGYYRAKALLYMLIADLFEYIPYDIRQVSSNYTENTELLMSIIEFIQEKYNQDTVLEDLYRDMGLSEKTVYRFLKKHIGLSQKELLDINRIEEAKKLLKYSDRSIQYISDICGFKSENTFYRIFKKIVGTTPHDYKVAGRKETMSQKINGYLSFNKSEAIKILNEFI